MNPLAIFAGPYGLLIKWGIIASLVASFAGYFWMKGNEHGTQKLLDYQAAQAIEAVRIAKGRDTVTVKVVDNFIKVKGETKVRTEYIDREIVRYENTGLCLDADWRRLHDAAARNAVPDAGLKPDGERGAPTAATALKTVTANYAACHRTADRLDALQGWVRGQQSVSQRGRYLPHLALGNAGEEWKP